MPKETFLRLDPLKKEKFTAAFLREFALNSFDDASITSVVKSLGIAKGSVYQYFEGKTDLFMFLISECTIVKTKYIAHLNRQDFPDFWGYYRALYKEGVKFDLENPLQSHFLHNLTSNLNSPSVKSIFQQLMEQTLTGLELLIKPEVENGHFRDDLPLKVMSFYLYKSSLAISEYMQAYSGLDPAESIKSGKPVYQGKTKDLIKTVDEYIALLRASFDK